MYEPIYSISSEQILHFKCQNEKQRLNLCFNLFWFCNVNFLLILITCHWILGCKSLSLFSVCVKGAKHSFRKIIFFPDSILHIHFCLHMPFFPMEFIRRMMWYSGSPVFSKNITNTTCTLTSTWVWGKCERLWQGTRKSFLLIMPGSNTHFNEDHALYFTLCHASKRKSPWACRAQDVIGFRTVWGNYLSKIFSVLTTSFCCWCPWRVHHFLSLHAKMEKLIGVFKRRN